LISKTAETPEGFETDSLLRDFPEEENHQNLAGLLL
jgi:hypothetical protein